MGSSLEERVTLWVASSFLSKDSWDPPRQQVLVGDQEAALRSGPLKCSWFPFKPENQHLHSPWAVTPPNRGPRMLTGLQVWGGPSGP